jgi:hypothetical protein
MQIMTRRAEFAEERREGLLSSNNNISQHFFSS